MRVIGIDPSSSSTGVAFVTDGKLKHTKLWTPNKKMSESANIYDYFQWLTLLIAKNPSDMGIVELCTVARNLNTVRKLAYFEATSVLALKHFNILTFKARVTQARAHVLGDGGTDKVEAYRLVKKRVKNYAWSPINRGGTDETDAYILAMAGPDIAEKT